MWGEIQLHPYVGGALGVPLEAPSPLKLPPTQGEGGLGEALENASGEPDKEEREAKKNDAIFVVPGYERAMTMRASALWSMAEGEGRENMHHGGRWGWRPANNLWAVFSSPNSSKFSKFSITSKY